MTSVDPSSVFDSINEIREKRESGFEGSVVRRLFQHAGRLPVFKGLQLAWSAENGNQPMPFWYFLERYPAFPLVLATRKLSSIHNMTLWECLDKSKVLKSQIYKAYLEQRETWTSDDDSESFRDYPFGMVFNVHGFTKFVIHNRAVDDEIVERRKQWSHLVIPVATFSPPLILNVQPLAGLLADVGTDWID